MDYKIKQRDDNFARASHLFVLYISLPFLHYYDVKMPNFAYYGEFKQATTNLDMVAWNSTSGGFTYI